MMLGVMMAAASAGAALVGIQATDPTISVPPPIVAAPPPSPAMAPVAWPTEAQNDFTRCDGALPPNAESPNMRRYVDFGYKEPRRGGMNGVIHGKGGIERKGLGDYVIAWGRDGANACAKALVDGRVAAWPYRRSQLERAQIVHLLAAGEKGQAIEKLDRFARDAPGRGTMLHRFGVESSVALIRAWLASHDGKPAEAGSIAARLRQDRPYSPSIQRALLPYLIAGDGSDWAALTGALSRLQAIEPSHDVLEMLLAARSSDFDAVIALDRRSYRFKPSQRDEWTYHQGAIEEGRAIVMFGGHAAYALAALGRTTEAANRLNAADAQLDAYLSAEVRRLVKSDARRLREAIATMGKAEITRWRAMIAARQQAAATPNDPGNDGRFRANRPTSFMFVADVARLTGKTADANIAMVRETAVQAMTVVSAAELGNTLPTLDHVNARLAIRNAENWLLTHKDGVSATDEKDGTTTVRFSADGISEEATDELALLAAARRARSLGKSHLIILSRTTLPRVQENCLVPPACFKMHMGFESQIRFIAINPDAISPAFVAMRNRMIDASQAQGVIERQYAGVLAAPR